jgi:hypothetical protein
MGDIRAGVPCATTGVVGEKSDGTGVLGAPVIATGIDVAVVATGVALPEIEDVGDDV